VVTPEWPAALANAHPEIIVAPLIRNRVNQAKSELHWLESACVGAPCIAERWQGGPGPYDVIRDGVDGLLASGRREWSKAVGRLIGSPQLRADLAGCALERVRRDYNPQKRAREMAEAWRSVAERPGIGAA
jgi:spore maturation protein CgeB